MRFSLFFIFLVLMIATASAQLQLCSVIDNQSVILNNIYVEQSTTAATGYYILDSYSTGWSGASYKNWNNDCFIRSINNIGKLQYIRLDYTTQDVYQIIYRCYSASDRYDVIYDFLPVVHSCSIWYGNTSNIVGSYMMYMFDSRTIEIYFSWNKNYYNVPKDAVMNTTSASATLIRCNCYKCEYIASNPRSIQGYVRTTNYDIYLQNYAGSIKVDYRIDNILLIPLTHTSTLTSNANITLRTQEPWSITKLEFCYDNNSAKYRLFVNLSMPRNVNVKNANGLTLINGSYQQIDVASESCPILSIEGSNFTYLYNQRCTIKTEEIEAVKLIIYSANGLKIPSRVIIDGVEYITQNGDLSLSGHYSGKNVNITVYPLYDIGFNESFENITLHQGLNHLNLSSYFYAVQLRGFYKDLLGNLKEISFNWQISGVMRPYKATTAGNFFMAGTAFSNYTVLIPAGEYTVNFTANILGFEKTASENLTLLDDKYYRYVTFIASVTDAEAEQGEAISAMLHVIIKDQYDRDVNNATVKVYDANNSLIAQQISSNGHVLVGGLQIGSTYKVEVWVDSNKKAEKSVLMDSASKTVIITINLNEAERQQLESGIGVSGGSGGSGGITAINLLTSLLTNYAVIAFIIICALAVYASQYGGERIGLIVFVAGLGILTYVVPLLPAAIFVTILIVSAILFTWKIVNKLDGGEN